MPQGHPSVIPSNADLFSGVLLGGGLCHTFRDQSKDEQQRDAMTTSQDSDKYQLP